MEQRTITEVNSSYVVSTVIFDVIAFTFLIAALATNYWAVIQNSSGRDLHMGLYRICNSYQKYGNGNGYNHNDDDCADLDDIRWVHKDVVKATRGLCVTTAVLYSLAAVAILVCACLKDNIPAAKIIAWVSFSFSLGGALLNGIAVIHYTAKVIGAYTDNGSYSHSDPKVVGSYSLVLAWLAVFIVLGGVGCTRGVVRDRPQRVVPTIALVGGQQQVMVNPMAGPVLYNPGVQVVHSNLGGPSVYNPYPVVQTLGQPGYSSYPTGQTLGQPGYSPYPMAQTPGPPGYNPSQYKGGPADNPNPLYENQSAPFETQPPQ